VSAVPEPAAERTRRPFDTDFVRSHFPAFADPGLDGFAHLENAGGSYASAPVIERLERFYRSTKLQPYYPSVPSTRGGEAMDEARTRLAAWMGVTQDELVFGPSTTQNTYVLAQALRGWMQPGDEVVISRQDHEANRGAFHRLEQEGFRVREWAVDPQTGELSTAGLEAVLNERTRAVAFTHCSNVVGSVNPVREWCERIRATGAMSIVDGVSYAPHGIPQPADLGADVYLYSLYKVYGPHLGIMTVATQWHEKLANQGHFFNAGAARLRLAPAGPDHAQVAAAAGVVDYLELLHRHHFPGSATSSAANDPSTAAREVHDLLRAREKQLVTPLLDWLAARPDVRMIGRTTAGGRAPTVSFTVSNKSPRDICETLAHQNIGTGYGNFYAYRLVEDLGIDPAVGVLRCSLVHYNTEEEVARLISALGEILS